MRLGLKIIHSIEHFGTMIVSMRPAIAEKKEFTAIVRPLCGVDRIQPHYIIMNWTI